MDFNPYHAPEASGYQPVSASDDAVAIRQLYLSHEASIKGLGLLYMIGGVLLLLGAIGLVAVAFVPAPSGSPKQEPFALILIPVYLGLGVLQLFTGKAMRKFKPWARIVGIVFSAIGLIGFPVGTIISGYFLYLLAGKKGSMVFSPDYQLIIEQTPGMKYRTSMVVKVLLILFIVLIVGAIGWLAISESR